MKQIIKFTISLALSLVCISALGSDRQARREIWRNKNPKLFSATVSISGYPELASYSLSDYYSSSGLVSSLYSDYYGTARTTGNIGGEFNWNISRWFNASGYLGFCPVWNDIHNGITNNIIGRKTNVSICIMPKAKVMWCNSPLVRAYSSLSIGLALRPKSGSTGYNLKSAYQFNLVGVEIGRKWFGFFELGTGTVYIGGKVGFGFKF